MILYIKNMVCDRCKLVVRTELKKLRIRHVSVELGEVFLENELTDKQFSEFNKNLQALGFEIIDNNNVRIIEKIKNIIIDLIHHSKAEIKINYSDYIAEKLKKDYTYLSNLFSEIEGNTIEKYIIHQKIERVKELLVYNELTLSEIAYQMGYSSVAYLSGVFKKVTGLTPSHFKEIRENKRKSLDKI